MANRMHPQAERLLDAHVDHVMSRLHGPALAAALAREVDELYAESRRLTLNDVVTRDMIKATVRTYAVEIDPSGAIPELIGDIARTLYAHPVHGDTMLVDLLPDALFEEFLDKILEMRDLHQWIAHEAVSNPLYSLLVTDVVIEGIRGYVYHGGERARQLPGMRQATALGRGLLRGALPALEASLEEGLRGYLQGSIRELLRKSEDLLLNLFDQEQVRALVLEAWDGIKHKRVADFQEGVSSLDIEEFFVIGYEFWRSLRTTPFYTSLIDSGIDAFFDKYGDTTLREILDEMGVTPEIACNEALRFAPHVLGVLRRKQMLEPMVRRQLAPFYESEAVGAILASLPPAEGATAPAGAGAPPAKAPARKTARPKAGKPPADA